MRFDRAPQSLDAPLRLGVLLTFQTRPGSGVGTAQAYAESVQLAAESERLGVDDVWLTEHHLEEDGYCPAPNVAAAAIAAVTSRVRIAQAIAIGPLQGHPLRMAEDLSVVDNISGGRVEVGLGQGYRREEFAAFGMRYELRTRAFDEGLDILDQAWTGERFTYEGSVYRSVDGVLRPAPVSPGLPPLWLGAATPKARERAVRRRSGLVISLLTEHEHTSRQFASFDREVARQGAPELPKALIREVFVAGDDDEARRLVAPHLDYIYREQYSPQRTGMTYVDRVSGERRVFSSADDPHYLSPEFVEDRFVVGGPEHCAHRLADLVRRNGLRRLIFRPQFPGQPLDEAVTTVRRVTTEVMPLVHRLLTDEQLPLPTGDAGAAVPAPSA